MLSQLHHLYLHTDDDDDDDDDWTVEGGSRPLIKQKKYFAGAFRTNSHRTVTQNFTVRVDELSCVSWRGGGRARQEEADAD